MSIPLRALLVEDSEDDADLLLRMLRTEGFEPAYERVQTADKMRGALTAGEWDIILCDYSMPGFDATTALRLFRESGVELPFIVISGAISEERAVAVMKLGATDFLLKDRLTRLGAAVRQALEQSRLRREHHEMEENLRMSQEMLQTIFDSAPVAILALNLRGQVTKWNAEAARLFGWTEAEVLGKVCPTVPEEGEDDFLAMIQRVAREGPETGMISPRQKKSGQRIQASLSAAPLRSPAGDVTGVMVILEDVSARLQSEAARQRAETEQRQIAEQLAEEKARLIAAQAVAKVGSWETDLANGAVHWSDETHRIFETDPADFRPTHAGFLERVHPDDRAKVDRAFIDSLARRSPSAIEHRILLPDGRSKVVEERWQVFFDDQGEPIRAVGTCQDITDRKRAEGALRESEERFRAMFEHAGIGIALVEPTDGRLLRCNRALAGMLGYQVEEMGDLTVESVSVAEDYGKDRAQWERLLAGEIASFQMEKRYVRKDGTLLWGLLTSTLVRDANGRPLFIIGMVEAIDDRKLAEAELRAAEQQLHALVDRLHSAREEEAKRIARELHDDLGQRLTALNMELTDLDGKLPGMTPGQRQQIGRMRDMVDHTIEVVQKISGELRLGQLDVLGLTAAIEWHVQEFCRRSAIPCTCVHLDEVAGLGDVQKTAVFRILQEALTNVARHAGATAVEVGLAATPDQITLRVHDNGRGITEAALKDRKAIGLLGMRERAQLLGGSVTITGGAGTGTTVTVTIPRHGAAAPPA